MNETLRKLDEAEKAEWAKVWLSDYIQHVGIDSVEFANLMRNNIRALIDIAKAAGALRGDLMARDEDPTHFSSWFALEEALAKLRDGNVE